MSIGTSRIFGALLIVTMLGARNARAAEPAKKPPASPSVMRFTDVTGACGIDFTMTCGKTPSEYILEVDGGGVALFDYDNDGDLDIFLANGATIADPEHGPGSRLYANNGDGTFQDVTKKTGIALTRWAMGVTTGDYDGDGFDDVYVTCHGPNVLLRNAPGPNSTRRFVDVTDQAGVGDKRWGTSAAFGDIDADGDLDLYVANYLEFDTNSPPPRTGMVFLGVPVMAGPAGLAPQADVLYENLGNGKFRDITSESGCDPEDNAYGLGVVILDFDRDGKQDILVGNDSNENFLYHNQGNGKFKDIGVYSGVASNGDGASQATMGIAIGDVDGNGFPDVFSTNFSSDTNTLHLNLGDLFFDDRTPQFGLAMVSRSFLSWGTGLYDFDSDGDEDLFIASGHVYPETATHRMDSAYRQPPLLFERRDKRFHRREDAGAMFAKKYSARSCAFGDLDNDGDVDIVMTTLNGPVHVFRNDSPPKDVLVVELEQSGGNRRALGAVVELYVGNLHAGELHVGGSQVGESVQRRWIHGGSFQSADAPVAYFGLGGAKSGRTAGGDRTAISLRVVWPDGTTSEFADLPRNRHITVRKGDKKFSARALRERSG